MPVIDVRHATHTYGQGRMRRTVLRDVTVRMDEHRIGVIGAIHPIVASNFSVPFACSGLEMDIEGFSVKK